MSPDDEHRLSEQEMFTDFDFEAFCEALFVESPVDFAFLHSLPRIFFNKRDIVEAERAAALRDKYPNRFLLYANVNPLDTDRALKRLDYHVNELGARALKLYPTSPHGTRLVGWRMDDANLAFPVFERCLELDITNVAIHKAVLLGAADPRRSRSAMWNARHARFPRSTSRSSTPDGRTGRDQHHDGALPQHLRQPGDDVQPDRQPATHVRPDPRPHALPGSRRSDRLL